MFIYSNDLDLNLKKGYCAFFCDNCRGIHTMKVSYHYKIPCIYFIPFWLGKHHRTLLICSNCKNQREYGPSSNFHIQKRCQDISILVQDVPDEALESWKIKLAKDIMMEKGSEEISEQDRLQRIYDSFASLEGVFNSKMGRGPSLEKGMFKPFFSLIGFIALSVWQGENICSGKSGEVIRDLTTLDSVMALICLNVIAVVIFIVWAVITQEKRVFHIHIYPKVAENLISIKPTLDELKTVKANLRKNGYRIYKFKLDDFNKFCIEKNAPNKTF